MVTSDMEPITYAKIKVTFRCSVSNQNYHTMMEVNSASMEMIIASHMETGIENKEQA